MTTRQTTANPIMRRFDTLCSGTATNRCVIVMLGVLAGVALVGVNFIWLRRRSRRRAFSQDRAAVALQSTDFPRQNFTGLTEAEAASRQAIDPNVVQVERRTCLRRTVILRTTFSIFNATLLGLAVVMFLLDDPWGGWLTLALLLFNIGLRVLQQLVAAKQLEQLAERAQLTVTVIRDGQHRVISFLAVVKGDVVVFGPGDEFVCQGTLLTKTPILVAQALDAIDVNQVTLRQTGDVLCPGEVCIRGAGAYRATEAPSAAPDAGSIHTMPGTPGDLTPIQILMDKVLHILIGIAIIFLLLMVADLARLPLLPSEVKRLYREIASVVFSIAPSGLFFTVLVTYALGAALLARQGALVRDTGTVEALAQTTVICFGVSGILTNTRLNTEVLPPLAPEHAVPAGRAVQLLGIFAHSVEAINGLTRLIADGYDGQRYVPAEEVGHAVGGTWQAITLSEPEVRGTYVLGEERRLADNLVTTSQDISAAASADETAEAPLRTWRRRIRSLRSHRTGQYQLSEAEANVLSSDRKELSTPVTAGVSDRIDTPRVRRRAALAWRSLTESIRMQFPGSEQLNDPSDAHGAAAEPTEPSVPDHLLFAYKGNLDPLHDGVGRPQLPSDLIPLVYLEIAGEARAGADAAMLAFQEAGVQVKVLSSASPAGIDRLLRELRVAHAENHEPLILTGAEFDALDRVELAEAVTRANVIAGVSPDQQRKAVQLLKAAGESVTFVGDSLADVPAMKEATVSVALNSSSRAALNAADIILEGNTLSNLADVLQIGQRVVNGLLNILKLNLTQVGYVLLLILGMVLSGSRVFFYSPSQGGVVIAYTLVLPSIALTLWARSGVVARATIYRRLIRFAVPAAVTVAASILIMASRNFAAESIEYSRLVITTLLMMEGLVLVVFVQPAVRLLAGGGSPTGDWRPIWLAVALFGGFLALSTLPRAQDWFKLGLLTAPMEYLVLVSVTLIWAIILQAIWRVMPRIGAPVRDIAEGTDSNQSGQPVT